MFMVRRGRLQVTDEAEARGPTAVPISTVSSVGDWLIGLAEFACSMAAAKLLSSCRFRQRLHRLSAEREDPHPETALGINDETHSLVT